MVMQVLPSIEVTPSISAFSPQSAPSLHSFSFEHLQVPARYLSLSWLRSSWRLVSIQQLKQFAVVEHRVQLR
jgi:hypothetical protein